MKTNIENVTKKILEDFGENEKLKNIITQLNDLNKGGADDMGNVGYYARNLHMQFYSYIHLQKNHDKFAQAQQPIKYSKINNELYKEVEDFHNCILYIAQMCIKPILENYPSIAKYLSPYAQSKILFEGEIKESKYIKNSSVENLASAFQSHPNFLFFHDCLKRGYGSFFKDEVQFPQLFFSILNDMGRVGLEKVPEPIDRLFGPRVQGDTVNELTRFGLVSASLYQQLQNIAQFIFQSLMVKGCYQINENNMISVSGVHQNFLHEWTAIQIQPDFQEMFINPGDILWVDFKMGKDGFSMTKYAVPYSVSMTLGGESGYTSTLKIKFVDELLNPFANVSR